MARNRRRGSMPAIVVAIAVMVAAACIATSQAAAKTPTAETPLTHEITADAEPLAREILSDYQGTKPSMRQEQRLGGDSVFGTMDRTQITFEVYAHSTITGKLAEYVIEADFARHGSHTLDPRNVISIKLSEPTHVLAIPLWRDISRTTYSLSFTATHHGALVENSYPLYWNISAEYFIGQPDQINNSAGYVSGGGNSNYDGAGGGLCLDPLPSSVLPLVDAQAQQFLQFAERHQPITRMTNLSSDFGECKLP